MTRPLFTLIATALTVGALGAAPPKPRPAASYSHLWTRSPFTDKPEVQAADVKGALDDWILTGVSPVAGGWQVRLMAKKDRKERIVIDSTKGATNGIEIVEVNQAPHFTDTVVRLSLDGKTGQLKFDRKSLKLANQPAKPAPKKNTQRNGQARNNNAPPFNPNQQNNRNNKQNKNKPKIVLPNQSPKK